MLYISVLLYLASYSKDAAITLMAFWPFWANKLKFKVVLKLWKLENE